MNEIKYEPLYGLQKPFDNGPADSTAYGLFRDGDEYIYYKIDKTSVYCFDTDNQWSHIDGAPTIPFLAMRRIIKEPKRWTVEDQKAGIFPDIGCVIQYSSNKERGIVEAVNKEDYQLCIKTDDGLFISYLQDLKPIETPEEKAERLRNEWINEAINAVRKTDVNGYESIYDALLSGALSVPTKGGE